MLSVIALKHFEEIWGLFDGKMFGMRGSMFAIEPFKQYSSVEFAEGLTEEDAKTRLHRRLREWGEIEQSEHEVELDPTMKFEDGSQAQIYRSVDPRVKECRSFILSAFPNVCSVAMYKKPIEQLVFEAWQYMAVQDPKKATREAFYRLIGLSKSFLLADWTQQIFSNAISNNDKTLFEGLPKWIVRDTAIERFDTARSWLGTTLLWYLGGKDISPRLQFLHQLKNLDIVSRAMDVPVLNGELHKLQLIK